MTSLFLAKMKHVSGDFNRWITRFEDQMETCETVGVALSDEAKIHYFVLRGNQGDLHDLEHESPVPKNL